METMESTGLPALLGSASTEPLSEAASSCSSAASSLYLWARPFPSAGSVESCCRSSSSRSEMWWLLAASSASGACCCCSSPVSCWTAGGSAISAISSPAASSLSSDDALIGTDSCWAWLRAWLWALQASPELRERRGGTISTQPGGAEGWVGHLASWAERGWLQQQRSRFTQLSL